MEGHTGIFNINYLPTENLSFNISSAYTDSKAHMESFNFEGKMNYRAGEYPERDLGYMPDKSGFQRDYNYNFSSVPDYSDLHIRELDLTLGTSYVINKNFSLGLEYNYLYYGDEEPYPGIYDGTGRAHIGMLTLTYRAM